MAGEITNVGSLDSIELLRDASFVKRFPGIESVAGFVASAADTMEAQGAPYKLFENLRVKDIREYICLLNSDNKSAIAKYEAIKRVLMF